MMRLTPFALVLCIALPAWAQDGAEKKPDPAPKPDKPAKVEKKAPSDLEAELDVQEAHWYRVRINTGESLLGLARPKKLWEVRIRGSRFDPVKRDKEGAGVRLWYVKNQLGFVFIPAKDVVGKPRDLGQASEEDALKIKQDRERAKRLAEEARKAAVEQTKKMKQRLKDRRAGKGGKDGATSSAGKTPMESLTPLQQALLKKFPPDTWTPNTPDKIQHRKIVIGTFPTDKEKEFIEVFDKWKGAWDALQDAKKKAAEAKKKAEGAKPAEGTKSEGSTGGPKPAEK